ncbi:ogr/Delta-like zinc finger family protein [Leptospira sp. 96542]|nr:ogr/Delta-like zinc finger family protein [Leptospira sp. 96542]
MRFLCPHCNTPSTVRTSEQLAPTFTVMYVQCPNLACGFCWRVDAEVVSAMVPSGSPNPQVNVPLSKDAQDRAIAVQAPFLPRRKNQDRRTIDLFIPQIAAPPSG